LFAAEQFVVVDGQLTEPCAQVAVQTVSSWEETPTSSPSTGTSAGTPPHPSARLAAQANTNSFKPFMVSPYREGVRAEEDRAAGYLLQFSQQPQFKPPTGSAAPWGEAMLTA